MDILSVFLWYVKVIGITIGILVAIGACIALGTYLWIMFQWKVLGIKPFIQIDELIHDSVRSCASEFVRERKRKATETGTALTGEEEADLRQEIQKLCRDVLDNYIYSFAHIYPLSKRTEGSKEREA